MKNIRMDCIEALHEQIGTQNGAGVRCMPLDDGTTTTSTPAAGGGGAAAAAILDQCESAAAVHVSPIRLLGSSIDLYGCISLPLACCPELQNMMRQHHAFCRPEPKKICFVDKLLAKVMTGKQRTENMAAHSNTTAMTAPS